MSMVLPFARSRISSAVTQMHRQANQELYQLQRSGLGLIERATRLRIISPSEQMRLAGVLRQRRQRLSRQLARSTTPHAIQSVGAQASHKYALEISTLRSRLHRRERVLPYAERLERISAMAFTELNRLREEGKISGFAYDIAAVTINSYHAACYRSLQQELPAEEEQSDSAHRFIDACYSMMLSLVRGAATRQVRWLSNRQCAAEMQSTVSPYHPDGRLQAHIRIPAPRQSAQI